MIIRLLTMPFSVSITFYITLNYTINSLKFSQVCYIWRDHETRHQIMKVTRHLKCQMTLDTIGTIQEPCSINTIMYIKEGLSADQSEGC